MQRLALLTAALSLAACSSSQDASKSNFKTAIQAYYDANPACLEVEAEFPHVTAPTDMGYKRTAPILDELVNLGFLSSTPVERDKRGFFPADGPREKEPATQYTLTDKGKQVASKPTGRPFASHNTDFCYGKYRVVEVTNFTAPADTFGQKVTRVHYTYQADDIADWAKSSEALQTHWQQLVRDIASEETPYKGRAALVLTNEGWMHEKLFKQ